LGLVRDVIVHDAITLAGRDNHAAFAAAYFGGADHRDIQMTRETVSTSAPVIPTISANGQFNAEIPTFSMALTGCDVDTMTRS